MVQQTLATLTRLSLKTYCDAEVNLNTRPIAGDYGKGERV